MNAKEREEHRQQPVRFCKSHVDKPVHVSGMWTGDFIGRVSAVGHTEVSFRFEKLAGGILIAGDVVTFPYGFYLKIRDLTDAEAQITITEAVGDIAIV